MAYERFQSVTHVEVSAADAGQRIDNYLMRELRHVPRSLVYRVLRTGQVRVNGGRVRPEYRLVAGDKLRLPPVRVAEQPVTAPSRSLRDFVTSAVIYEDSDLLVVNKPAGVAVHGGSGLSFGVIEALRSVYPEQRELELVHRLDRETSGCLLVAKRRSTLRELHALLRERSMDKQYLALVCGHWSLGRKSLDLPLETQHRQGGERVVRVHPQGQTALSLFDPAQHFGAHATLMNISIGTGRTHQIRVHAAHCGHPVAGDDKYGTREQNEKLRKFGLERMFLHAHQLSFVRKSGPFSITAPLDPVLQKVLTRLAQPNG
jgi:23S rRNA pseudouridine955/2504/2580 synthase